MVRVLFDELDENFDDYDYYDLENMFDNSYAKKQYILHGKIGLWDGVRYGYAPDSYKSIIEAINKATDGFGACYLRIVEENYGRLFVEVCHHDGNNRLEVRELTDMGEELLYSQGIDAVVNRKGATRNVKFTRRYY